MRSRSKRLRQETSEVTNRVRRKLLQCRLCFRVLSKEELPEIFPGNETSVQEAIHSAVSIEVTKQDRAVRICHSCLYMVHMINDFRIICEKTQLLFTKHQLLSVGEFWNKACDQEIFVKCFALVQQCKNSIEELCLKQYVSDLTNNVASHSFDLPADNKQETESYHEQLDQQVKDELVEFKADISVCRDSYENSQCTLKSEQGSISGEDSEDDRIGSFEENLADLRGETVSKKKDLEEEQQMHGEADFEVDDPEFVTKPKRAKRAPDEPRRRRGRPALPEEMLKRRRRKPGEPKKKPGPKNRIKLPTQSVCEICGKLVNRENQERHRNDHLGHRPYPCTIDGCSHAFSSKAGLHGHLARHADRDNVYDCDICGAKIKTKSSLHRHRKMHTMEKPHACDICGKRFWRKSYLNHHSTVHTGIAKFPCEYCGFVFKNKYWRSFHIKQKHVAKGEEPRLETLEEDAEIPEEVVTEISIEYI
ncbi:zinc finger and SCAN domain-containing protein 12-like isoform X2 [Wyeomyia smithii]|uniref:zinc finger and SCAN domain-containing protein 12-like isoform X2 n=1 Tax=Wyeomyia smithii TaxID=174621 RepID=UPI0024680741|nr:zinc finger and SCAN domain-containing protein 12-like isoform X2 [Wyeomyia smithii]